MTNWISPVPRTCDLCKAPITNTFIDGKTSFGPWAIMCEPCHNLNGKGLGQGKGQKYLQQSAGHFIKVGG